jgi:hypothetical protein
MSGAEFEFAQSPERLCYNCRQPGHESTACPSPRTTAAKQCYACGGVGHIQSDCPSVRIAKASSTGKCYVRVSFSHHCTRWKRGRFNGPIWALMCFHSSFPVELRQVRPPCAKLHCRTEFCWWWRDSRTTSRPRTQHVYATRYQVLSMWPSKPYGTVRPLQIGMKGTILDLIHSYTLRRDCLAPATDSTGFTPTPTNKNKTCYKCHQEGHVGHSYR